MKHLLVYISPQIGVAQAQLAFLSLQKSAESTEQQLTLRHGGAVSSQKLDSINGLIVLGDNSIDASLEESFNVTRQTLHDAINNPTEVLAHASPRLTTTTTADTATHDSVETEALEPVTHNTNSETAHNKYIVGVTSCPTGIAHTFMAAESLEIAAKELGFDVKVETQGSVGAQNMLTEEDIARADCVVIAADVNVDLERFDGKKLYSTGTKAAINDGQAIINTALSTDNVHTSAAATSTSGSESPEVDGSSSLSDIYKHLMTGVSHMLPFVVAGGLLIAIGFAIGSFEFGENGIHIYRDEYKETLGATLFWIGKAAFALFVPILGGYIAYSISGRAALAAGMIGGYMANEGGSGFLGAILAGFVAGYVVLWLTKTIKLPKSMAGLMPILILPLLSVMTVGLLMHYVIGAPVASANAGLTVWLESLTGTNAAVLGLILGCMMAVDMGGPVNKAAYVFGTGLLGSQVYEPMAAIMAAGMTPPLAIFVASMLFKNRFLEEEQEAAKAAGVLGISFITEGAIPFAARDPLRVIPALMAGSGTAGALSMLFNCGLLAPHGGIFVLFIPNAVNNLLMYVAAIAAGIAVSALLLGLFKKPVSITKA